MPSSNPRRVPSAERLATLLLLALYVFWVLSLPAWPSQDGPVHLYFTQVLGLLLGHTGSVYPPYFFIKHLLPPYALYYYLLLLLSRFVPLLLADRLVICAYLILFLKGFHALAGAIAPTNPKGADRATLLASLLLLNWPLGMGFVNYCLSLALALWALALWFSPPAASPYRKTIPFLLLIIAITLAHPVPLLLVLGICALDLLTRPLHTRTGQASSTKRDLITFALAALPLFYVKAFTAPHLLAQRTSEAGPLQRAMQRTTGYVQGKSVSLLFGHSLAVDLYRAALFLTLLLALAAAIHQLLRDRKHRGFTTPSLFLFAALLLLVTLPWLPSDISGAYFFPERLILLIWVFALLAAAGWRPSPSPIRTSQSAPWLTPLLVTFVTAASLALIVSANTALRPFAHEAQSLEHTPLLHSGDLVLSLESQTLPSPPGILPSWNPNYWMAVHTIRGNHAVLANAPWLDSSIIPLAARPALLAENLSPQLANSPHALTVLLRQQPDLAQHLTSTSTAVSFNPAIIQPASQPDPLLLTPGSPLASWHCQKTPDGIEQICRHEP